MSIFRTFLAIVFVSWSLATVSHALTIEEIIKLKQAGVGDSTIELLIERSGDARSAGSWKQDGWIIHSTESRFPDKPRIEPHHGFNPIAVYPRVLGGRRHRVK
ncbi:MAG: hypothetical protein OEN50_12810 [Deltaproteobacteria bacterium]|nr:hypothetical protein [Deltaproteobacteria bacterium]